MSIKAVLVAVALVATPGIALACTPAPPPKLTAAEQLGQDQQIASAAEKPWLAETLRNAVDISVVSVAGFKSGSRTDIPPQNWHSLPWYHRVGLDPVRYTLKVERRLKGAAPDTFPFRFFQRNSTSDREWAWAVAPNEEIWTFFLPRSEPEFWSDGRLSLGDFGGGPGDCSNQIALNSGVHYLVLRDATGLVTAAEPLASNDPLIDLIANFLKQPANDYIWRPSVAEFLALPGWVGVVRVADCSDDEAVVSETLRRGNERDPSVGEKVSLYRLKPSLRIAGCHAGDEYLLTGWYSGMRLHRIVDGVVRFEDGWMQIRFSGEKNIALNAVRAGLSGA